MLGDGSAGEQVWGWHSSALGLVYGVFGNGERQEKEKERTEGGGDGWKGGAGVAFVCFPRFKASLEK